MVYPLIVTIVCSAAVYCSNFITNLFKYWFLAVVLMEFVSDGLHCEKASDFLLQHLMYHVSNMLLLYVKIILRKLSKKYVM